MLSSESSHSNNSDGSPGSPGSLAGIRVLDFTHYLAGPFSTFQLALQGADVLKIEPIGGDGMRLSPIGRDWSERQLAPAWMASNVNKRSMTLDLARPQAIDIIERLVSDFDVVCENFRPGVMDRLGIGYQRLSQLHPRLIYCGVSGFGNSGPERRTASFDGKIQAMSGLMSITGEEVNGPMRAGFAVADISTGMTAAFAMACALFQRSQTGRGAFVDVSMLESMMSFLAPQVAEYTVADYRHQQFGNRSTSRKPTADRFRCGNGYIVLAVLTDKQFSSLLTALDRADALADPRFADWFSRTEHAQALRELIERGMREGDPKSWELKLTQADVPCATVHSIAEILEHPQMQARGFLNQVHTAYGPVRLAGAGFRIGDTAPSDTAPDDTAPDDTAPDDTAPIDALTLALPGEHNDEVLASLGFDAAQISVLRESKVIGSAHIVRNTK
jgi:crotonobetainyl-CoA:carnitine CoA-transferase CaiB-like acyl-CoA transferase